MQTTCEGLSFQGEQTNGRIAGGGMDSRGNFHQVGETRHVDGDGPLGRKNWWCRGRRVAGASSLSK